MLQSMVPEVQFVRIPWLVRPPIAKSVDHDAILLYNAKYFLSGMRAGKERADVIYHQGKVEITMQKWMIGIRGAVLMVVLWVVGWGLGYGGIMEIIDTDGKIQDVWPTLLAIPGLIGGVIFSVILAIAERDRKFDEISLVRFALWGGAAGLVLGILSTPAEGGDVSPG